MADMRAPGPNHPASRAIAARTALPDVCCQICRQRPATRGNECGVCFEIGLDLEARWEL